MNRANFIGAPQFFELNQACRVLTDAFGLCSYLVGSSLTRRDYRDVDIRTILPDDVFDAMFPGIGNGYQYSAKWSLFCSAISLWLSTRSGLPVDFQFQRQTQANAEFGGAARNSVGWFIEAPKSTPGEKDEPTKEEGPADFNVNTFTGQLARNEDGVCLLSHDGSLKRASSYPREWFSWLGVGSEVELTIERPNCAALPITWKGRLARTAIAAIGGASLSQGGIHTMSANWFEGIKDGTTIKVTTRPARSTRASL